MLFRDSGKKANWTSPRTVDTLQPHFEACSNAARLRLILGRLNAAAGAMDMDLPGLKLHELRGRKKGIWSVWVSGNWRITFRFNSKDAELIDYEDYH